MFNKTRRIGGVRIISSYAINEAFNKFFSNSVFSIFSEDGSVGVIIKARLKDNVDSPYKITRTNYFNKPVREILIKFSYVDVSNEVKIQQDLFLKTINDENTLLEPICPAIIYAYNGKFNKEQKIYAKTKIIENLENINDAEKIESIFNNRVYMFAMELMDGFIQLEKINRNLPEYKYYKYMALYELHRMHKHGYLHNDIHDKNILVNPDYSYYESTNGRVILIDFGSATKVINNNYDEMMNIDVGRIDKSLLEKIANSMQQQNIQRNYIVKMQIELNLNRTIKEILNRFLFYNGGYMNKTKRNILNEPTINRDRKKKLDFSDVTYDDIMEYESNKFFENMKKNNEKSYNMFMSSIESVKKEANPAEYFEKCVEETLHLQNK